MAGIVRTVGAGWTGRDEGGEEAPPPDIAPGRLVHSVRCNTLTATCRSRSYWTGLGVKEAGGQEKRNLR